MTTTAFQIIDMDNADQISKGQPKRRYATNHENDAIAIWHDNQWVMCAAKLPAGNWVTMGNLGINGELLTNDWIEIFPKHLSN